MPLYEYYCDVCEKELTLLQSSSVDKNETRCPDCDKAVKPQVSSCSAKIAGSSAYSRRGPVTADELPNKNVLNLPLPRLRSEL